MVWDIDVYALLENDQRADTVNPSLWRLAQFNNHVGLFQVAPSIYQQRGMDVSNMTIIDPLTVSETARAALELYYPHRPRKPVVAIAYSHSHADHFGGVRGDRPPLLVKQRRQGLAAVTQLHGPRVSCRAANLHDQTTHRRRSRW